MFNCEPAVSIIDRVGLWLLRLQVNRVMDAVYSRRALCVVQHDVTETMLAHRWGS